MILLAKLCLLFGSITGYSLFIAKKFCIRLEFVPALVCAWCSNLLFLGGILNIMPQLAGLIFAGGGILFVVSVKRGYRFSKRELFLYIVYLAGLLYFWLLLEGARFTSYDNFSHWATVVKNMLLEDRMPRFDDQIIRFQSYPLGSSLFIYYICRVLGLGEECFLWSQFVMLFSFLFCMAVLITKKKWYALLFPLMYSIWSLTVNNSIFELRVDTLLPLAAAAVFVMIYYYKEEPGKAAGCSVGLFMLLVNTKNSGIFFYAVCAAALAVFIKKYLVQHKIWFLNTCVLPPAAVMFLWKRHVALVFADGMGSKHAMSIENYGQQIAKKTTDDMLEIGLRILERFTELKNPEVYLMLALTFLIGMLWLMKEPVHKILRLAAAVWGCLAAYTLSMYGMYLFSMPLGEALHLASYDRYILSVLIFIYGIVVVYITEAVNIPAEGSIPSVFFLARSSMAGHMMLVLVVILMMCPILKNKTRLNMLYKRPVFNDTKRFCLQELIRRDGLEKGRSCFIYCNGTDDDKRYLFYLSRYELWSTDILVVRGQDFLEQKENILDYDYLILWDSDAETDQYLKEQNLGQYLGKERIGIEIAHGTAGDGRNVIVK